MFFFTPPAYIPPAQYYVDIIDKKVYNNISETYTTTDMYNEKVVTMSTGLLEAFSSKLGDFKKYAPKNILEAFCDEFIPKFENILQNYNEEKMFTLLDEWIDTIDIYSNPETIDELEISLKESTTGDTLSWKPGTFLE